MGADAPTTVRIPSPATLFMHVILLYSHLAVLGCDSDAAAP